MVTMMWRGETYTVNHGINRVRVPWPFHRDGYKLFGPRLIRRRRSSEMTSETWDEVATRIEETFIQAQVRASALATFERVSDLLESAPPSSGRPYAQQCSCCGFLACCCIQDTECIACKPALAALVWLFR